MDASAQDLPLPVVRDLISYLDRKDIRYCHWKSNQHLDAAVRGRTDLDLLFDEDDKQQVHRIFKDIGARKFSVPSYRDYPHIEDYLAIDRESEGLVHFHTHFRLVLGERFLKSYRLPWEEMILDERMHDEQFGIDVCEPHMEMILLLIRQALKLRSRDVLRGKLGKTDLVADNAQVEYRWLKERTTSEVITARVEELLNADIAEQMAEILQGNSLHWHSLHQLRTKVTPALAAYRRHSPTGARLRRWGREAVVRAGQRAQDVVPLPVTRRRGSPRGGLIVAFVGSDGAGKTTTTDAMERFFSSKIDVEKFYLGQLKLLKKIVKFRDSLLGRDAPDPHKAPKKTAEDKESGDGTTRYSTSILWHGWSVVDGLHKWLRLIQADIFRAQNFIVVCDRYPQTQVRGMNDGPSDWPDDDPPPWLKWMRTLEADLFARAENITPDLIIKLLAPPEIAHGRQDTLPIDEISAKHTATQSIDFGSIPVCTIDSNQPLDDVLDTIRNAIWQRL